MNSNFTEEELKTLFTNNARVLYRIENADDPNFSRCSASRDYVVLNALRENYCILQKHYSKWDKEDAR